jgi:XTP/dITP diphosphohydrolase
MEHVVLASRNAGKLAELRRILGGGFELVPLPASAPDVAETGATFEENALLKARSAATATGLPALADDSGLTVDALNGMPGVFSARWSGRHGDDAANLRLVLGQVADVPAERLGAAFVCAAAVALPGGGERVVRGEIRGRLIREPRGANGFGYDPIFVPDGEWRTTAEMPSGEKDAISHRGRAFRALADVLPEVLAGRTVQPDSTV